MSKGTECPSTVGMGRLQLRKMPSAIRVQFLDRLVISQVFGSLSFVFASALVILRV